LVLESLINQILRLAVAIEVIGDEVVVSVMHNGVCECGESTGVAEHAALDGLEYFLEFFVELVVAVDVGMAEFIDIFGEVSEEEDVVLTNFTSYFDLA
jgi:hypothetical protein